MRVPMIVLGLMVSPGLLPGQTDTAAERRLTTAAAAAFGRVVRVHSRVMGVSVGPLVQSRVDALLLGPDPSWIDVAGPVERVVPLAGLDTLWVLGRATEGGMRIGAIAGALVGGLVATGVCAGLQASWVGCDNYAHPILAGVGIGGISGALLGAGIGALTPRWHRRYPSELR